MTDSKGTDSYNIKTEVDAATINRASGRKRGRVSRPVAKERRFKYVKSN